jgi:hypothetical protein
MYGAAFVSLSMSRAGRFASPTRPCDPSNP